MEQLLTYGLFVDELKHISEVENGLACNCVCANCKHPLVAKNNPTNKKMAHFAHRSGKECDGSIETTLHLLAKSILHKTKRLKLPQYHYDYDNTNYKSIFEKNGTIEFDNIILEKSIEINGDKIIPDAICEIKGKRILVEFANTHFIDLNKRIKLKKSGYACIEIDLSEQPLDENILMELMTSETRLKYWVINQKLDNKYSEYKRRLFEQSLSKYNQYRNNKECKLLQINNKRVYNCPLKREAINKLKGNPFYRHKFLKKIIDDQNWNGKIYGYSPNGKFIYINNDKIFVYPPDNNIENSSDNEKKNNDVFFSGLNHINGIIEDEKIGYCRTCKFAVEQFLYEDTQYQVCKHPIE